VAADVPFLLNEI